MPQSAPVVPAAPDKIEPVPFPVARTAAQPLDESVALPIPERMPVITGRHEVPKLELAPIVLYEAEGAAAPAQEPIQANAPKPVVDEPRQQPAAQWAPVTRQAKQPVVTQPAQQAPEETPWWLTETPTHAETALIQPRAARMGTWHSGAANDEQTPAAPEAPEKQRADYEAPTRLSGLRGLVFPLGIKDSGSKKDAERDANASGKVDHIGYAPQADATAADPEQTIVIEAVTPRTEHQPVHAKSEGTVARGGAPRWVTAEPEFLPPREESADKGKDSRLKKTSHGEDDFSDIQILPARRGQYRR